MADMRRTQPVDVPLGSMLASFGEARDYRDCFCRVVEDAVSLPEFIERFYCSAAFRPERIALGLLGHGASNEDARALASGAADRFAVWKVVARHEAVPSGTASIWHTRSEILLHSPGTSTASWLAVVPIPFGTKLFFGSWVASIGQSGWRFMLHPHRWYSHLLLGFC